MTRQFDVIANPDTDDAGQRPYLVVLQSDLISGLHSAVVAPLASREQFSGARRLNPVVPIDGREFWLATHELFAVDRRVLRTPIANLSDHRDAIIAALDLVFTGI